MLSDPEKRKQYDAGGMFGGGGRFDPIAFRGGGGFGSVGDILSDLFGRGGGAAAVRRQRGRDLETEVRLSFDQAINGTQVSVTFRRRPPARPAAAAAPSPAPARRPVPQCQGRGIETEGQGMFSISQPCSRCGGRGTIDRRALPDLRRPRRDAPDQALPRQDPGRGARRQPHPAGGQGRARRGRWAARRPLRGHARRAVPGLQAQGRQPRGRGADLDRRGGARRHGRGADARAARSRSGFRPAPATAASSGCAARARRSSPARAAATSTTASGSRSPSR